MRFKTGLVDDMMTKNKKFFKSVWMKIFSKYD